MRRNVLIVGVAILLLLPLFLLAILNFDSIQKQFMATKYSLKRTSSSQYTVASSVTGLAPKIINTGYLEFQFAKLNVFGTDAISEPYSKDVGARKYTVTRVRIELVPTLDRFMVALGGKADFASRGTYSVDKDTLIIQVSVNPKEISGEPYALEDAYITTAMQVLTYATKSPTSSLDTKSLGAIDKDYQEYIKTGVFTRPIEVSKK